MPEEELPPTPPTPPPTITTWDNITLAQVQAQSDWEALMVSPMGTPYRVPKSLFGFATEEGVQEAQQDATQALQAANAAGQTATDALNAANGASQTASTVAQDASNALQAAGVAGQDATQALLDASNAQQTANTAVQDASTAQQTANQAVQDAATAQQTANTGVQDAATAQQAANAAQQSANTANSWIASPLSGQAGNQASLVSGKIFVPAPAAAVSTLGTVSSPVSVSNTTAETILASFAIAGGTLAAGDILDLLWAIRKGPAGHTGTVKVYLNTSNAIGGTTLHNVANGFNSNTMFMYNQKYVVTSAGLVIPNPVNASGGNNLTNFQTQSAMGAPAAFNPTTNYWLVVTSTQSAGNSLEILEFAKLFRLR
jgi:multidrug efflux pump subunit AcrA (membrane-fusion protein)